MHRSLMVVPVMVIWVLWQELLFLDQPDSPSWYIEDRFAAESACFEARQIRLIEHLLRAEGKGPTVLNQSPIADGTIWLQYPDGLRARMRLICLPDTIDPDESWFGHHDRAPLRRDSWSSGAQVEAGGLSLSVIAVY